MTGLIITIAASAALLAGLIWLFFIRSGKPKYPFVWKDTLAGITFEIFAEERIPFHTEYDLKPKIVPQTVNAVLKAARSFPGRFSDQDIKMLTKNFSKVAVAYLEQDEFMKQFPVLGTVNSAYYSPYQDKIYHGWTPMAVVSKAYKRGTLGDLLIHEWIHGVIMMMHKNSYDPSHNEQWYWLTFQQEAKRIFGEMQ